MELCVFIGTWCLGVLLKSTVHCFSACIGPGENVRATTHIIGKFLKSVFILV